MKMMKKGMKLGIFLCLLLCFVCGHADKAKAAGEPCEFVVTATDTTNSCTASLNILVSTIAGVQQFSLEPALGGVTNTLGPL